MRKLLYYTLAIMVYFLSPLIVALAVLTCWGEGRKDG
jgi:hypothetical protein